MKRIIFLMIFCCTSVSTVIAQALFEIKASKKIINKNDVLQVEYTVYNAGTVKDFVQPAFSNWRLVSGPFISEMESYINGTRESKAIYAYQLSPKSIGSLKIESTTVIADNKRIACSAIEVKVLNKVSAHTQGNTNLPSLFQDLNSQQLNNQPTLGPREQPENIIQKNIFIKAEASRTECVIGEPILVTYRLYAGLSTKLQVQKQPTFTGCSVIEMPFSDYPEDVQLNGKTYRSYIIRKVQLIPLQAGSVVLPPATVESNVEFMILNEGPKSFSSLLNSNSLTVSVKNFPQQVKNFNGSVGEFLISSKLKNQEVSAGNNNGLIITIEGQGNLQNVVLQNTDWDKQMDHFDAKETGETDKVTFPISVTKSFEFPFVVKNSGTSALPGFSFTYFNTTTRKFETISTKPLNITVEPAKILKDVIPPYNTINNQSYLWIVAALALIIGFVWVITSKKRNIPVKQPEIVIIEPKEDIPQSNQLLFEAVLKNKIEEFSSIKDFKQYYSLAKQFLLHILSKKDVEEYFNKALVQELVSECDAILYSPFEIETNRQQFHQKLKKLSYFNQ